MTLLLTIRRRQGRRPIFPSRGVGLHILGAGASALQDASQRCDGTRRSRLGFGSEKWRCRRGSLAHSSAGPEHRLLCKTRVRNTDSRFNQRHECPFPAENSNASIWRLSSADGPDFPAEAVDKATFGVGMPKVASDRNPAVHRPNSASERPSPASDRPNLWPRTVQAWHIEQQCTRIGQIWGAGSTKRVASDPPRLAVCPPSLAPDRPNPPRTVRSRPRMDQFFGLRVLKTQAVGTESKCVRAWPRGSTKFSSRPRSALQGAWESSSDLGAQNRDEAHREGCQRRLLQGPSFFDTPLDDAACRRQQWPHQKPTPVRLVAGAETPECRRSMALCSRSQERPFLVAQHRGRRRSRLCFGRRWARAAQHGVSNPYPRGLGAHRVAAEKVPSPGPPISLRRQARS